ncbi:type II toxin-antitoxin system HicA family toxin [Moraxella ovis]|uniref:type II toxin-antitoxin system HicA family toxin n=1 Tax=Moraxella ovis TaxID=29433 RepID=UPI000D92D7B0|nr:type II toxin-antitoxin system HicA family toxin [Moraxella ovis]SPX85373.1 YcfA-like protein [Moraxella ovis]STZ06324.1 YcfA-like protein [Moraxella ovis]
MPPSSDEMIKRITNDGWYQVKQTGSHKHYKHPAKAGKVTIPNGREHLPIGTLKSIIKQAGLE